MVHPLLVVVIAAAGAAGLAGLAALSLARLEDDAAVRARLSAVQLGVGLWPVLASAWLFEGPLAAAFAGFALTAAWVDRQTAWVPEAVFLPALILALPVGYLVASAVVDWHMATYAFALLAILLILIARGAHRTTRHELLGFLVILALVVAELRLGARVDVMVFTALVVAIVGAWRADRGTVPLWSILGTLLVLIASVS